MRTPQGWLKMVSSLGTSAGISSSLKPLAGLGFQPQYRVKRPGIDPTLLAGGGWLSKQESPLLQDPRA